MTHTKNYWSVNFFITCLDCTVILFLVFKSSPNPLHLGKCCRIFNTFGKYGMGDSNASLADPEQKTDTELTKMYSKYSLGNGVLK